MLRPTVALLALAATSLTIGQSVVVPKKFQSCQMTKPNGQVPPGGQRNISTPLWNWFGNGDMWTVLPDHGTISRTIVGVGSDASIHQKMMWWRGPKTQGKLSIQGHRLDAPAPPLNADIPDGYVSIFQPSGVFFPTEGCWEVTGTGGPVSLKFIVRVIGVPADK
jgi:hypothetical protein